MFGNPETTSGGMALKFYASVRLDVRRIESIKQGNDVIGNRSSVTDSGGQITTFEYDRRNLLTRANFPAGAGSERG